VADGVVYFGSAAGYVYAVDARTGKRVWRFKAPPGWMRSSPAINDGVIYFGSDDGNLYAVR
jgi:outer membrane protein assembly factor BamB